MSIKDSGKRTSKLSRQDRRPFRAKKTGSGLVAGVDYIGVGVGAMVFDVSSRVFLAKRGPLARNERHHWEFPGGNVLLHERLEEAIRREFREEFGMVIEPGQLLCIADHILEAEHQHWVSACFLARHISGQPKVKEPGKCLGIDWFSLSELPSPLTQISSSFLQAYHDKVEKPARDRLKKGLQLPQYINRVERRK